MQVNISGLHIEVTEALSNYVQSKLERLERHFDQISNVQVTLNVEKQRQHAEITLHVPGTQLHANAEHQDLYAAIDLLTDKIDRQLLKRKEKEVARLHGS